MANGQSTMEKTQLEMLKARVMQEKFMLERQKQSMFWMKYYTMMSMQMPLAQLKQFNNYNKMQIVQLQAENNDLKMGITRLQKEVSILKKDTEVLKKENSIKKWKKEKKKSSKAHAALINRYKMLYNDYTDYNY